MISRSQQFLAKVAVTVSPESQWISKPSEHQRKSLLATATSPSWGLLEALLVGVLVGAAGDLQGEGFAFTHGLGQGVDHMLVVHNLFTHVNRCPIVI